MTGIRILSAGYALPKQIIPNEELASHLETTNEWIVSRTGIRSRYVAREGEDAATLAEDAAKKALAHAAERDPAFTKEKITVVLTATMTSDYVFPSVSCILQRELGLPKTVSAFDISAACTGFVYALRTAAALLSQEENGCALVVGSECMSRILDWSDRSSSILFGDGAGAVVLEKSDTGSERFETCAGTYGNTRDLFCRKKPFGDGFLHMNGPQVYRFATGALRDTIETLLKKADCTLKEVDYVVCHQANARIIDSVKRRYPGYEGKIFMDLERLANTSAASVAIALADLFEQKTLQNGKTLLLAAFGAGLSCSGILTTI